MFKQTPGPLSEIDLLEAKQVSSGAQPLEIHNFFLLRGKDLLGPVLFFLRSSDYEPAKNYIENLSDSSSTEI